MYFVGETLVAGIIRTFRVLFTVGLLTGLIERGTLLEGSVVESLVE